MGRIVLALLLGVAFAVLIEDFNAIWAGVVLAVYFARKATVRIVTRKVLVQLIRACLTPRQRRRLDRRIARTREFAVVLAKSVWNALPEWLRIPLGLIAGMCAGVVLFIISYMPSIAWLAPAGPIVRTRVIPFLSRVAAARGIIHISPEAWERAPHTLREAAQQKYVLLWWWTMSRIVRHRITAWEVLPTYYGDHVKRKRKSWTRPHMPGID